MRILWIAPWGRPLARVYLEELFRQGHEALLVTTGGHFERWSGAEDYEALVDGTFKQPGSWPSMARAVRRARSFRPDVIVAEEFVDPRYLVLLGGAPHLTIMHDDDFHDDTEVDRWYHQRVYRRQARTSAMLLAFSGYVARALAPRTSIPVATVALPSDAGEAQVPPQVWPADRRDFVLMGRINPYKNLPGCFAAWEQHVASSAYRGDRLLVMGDGNESDIALPPACEWRRGHYQFAELMPLVAAAKGSLVYYTKASQSGVQVLAMQCGTTPIVSDVGGLPEYQPSGELPVPLGRPELLAEALDGLADPVKATERGRAARAWYERRHSPPAATNELLAVLDRLRTGQVSVTGLR